MVKKVNKVNKEKEDTLFVRAVKYEYLEGYCGFVVGNSDAGSVYCFLLFLDGSFGIVAGYFYG